MKSILTLFLILFLCGCSTVVQPVRIESSGPARIEMNGEYVGEAPGDFEFVVERSGRFGGYMMVKAYPVGPGVSEVKYFPVGSYAPRRMFFHMGLAPSPGVDVHVWR